MAELRWREGIAERFGMDQTEARRTSKIKDSVNGNEEMELEDWSVTKEFEVLGSLEGKRGGSPRVANCSLNI